MRLIPLTLDYELTEFNSGDEQLNDFLYEDAKPSLDLPIANTFILEDNGRIVAYFCILLSRLAALPYHKMIAVCISALILWRN